MSTFYEVYNTISDYINEYIINIITKDKINLIEIDDFIKSIIVIRNNYTPISIF